MLSNMTGRKLRIFGSKSKKKSDGPKNRRVFFVSHEATRTGAPKIILNILKHFSDNCDVKCESLLLSGGHLATEFARYSTVDCFNVPRERCDEMQKKVRRAVQREKGNPPILAVCNSMESRFVAETLNEMGIPTVSLVHELPSSYTEEDYQNIYECSRKVVFPVHAVRDAAHEKLPIPQGKSVVLPQGLLTPDFGKNSLREECHGQIRKELGIPENSFIVLGCGTLDLRKGIDHFAVVARRVIELNKSSTPIHFVWVGEGPRWVHSPYHYVQLDINKTPARNFVHFIGERENVEPYFVGSDAFFLSSRVDPFPCVIHESMAAGLPVITFADSGGAPEAVENGAGFVVPYADYEHTASIIRMLAKQPELANGVRQRSMERVETRFNFDDYADKIIDLCESVTSTRLRNPIERVRVAA